MDAASIIFGALVATAIPYFFRVEKYIRGVNRVLPKLLERCKSMATKEELAAAVGDLVTADAANKTAIAAKDAKIAELTAQLATAGSVDDGVVNQIKGVTADLNTPPAS